MEAWEEDNQTFTKGARGKGKKKNGKRKMLKSKKRGKKR
jgi:hypothetical protein